MNWKQALGYFFTLAVGGYLFFLAFQIKEAEGLTGTFYAMLVCASFTIGSIPVVARSKGQKKSGDH